MRAIVSLLITVFTVMAQALGRAAGVKEPFGIKCLWTFTLVDSEGRVKERRRFNLIVDTGFDAILMALFETVSASRPAPFGYMAIGGGATAPAASQTSLAGEFTSAPAYGVYQRQPVTKTFVPGSKTVTLSSVFGPNVGIGNVVEAGLFNDLTAGTMLNRVLIGAFNKAAGDTLTVQVEVGVQ